MIHREKPSRCHPADAGPGRSALSSQAQAHAHDPLIEFRTKETNRLLRIGTTQQVQVRKCTRRILSCIDFRYGEMNLNRHLGSFSVRPAGGNATGNRKRPMVRIISHESPTSPASSGSDHDPRTS